MSQFLNRLIWKLNKRWLKLIGLPSEFSIEARSFHAISVFSFIILLLLLPFNLWIGLISSSVIITILLILQAFFYYLSRHRGIHNPGIIAYIIATYATLAFSFFLDNGSNGPALPLFFLTFMLLIVLSPPRHHWIVVLTHITVAQSLLVAEQVMPETVRQTYKSINERYIDLISTYVITICFVYFMIRYLRNNYIREHKLAVYRLKSIEKKNKELEQINQEKNRIFSIIAHDLRSPIDSIQSYLELINMQALREEEKEIFNRSLLDLTQHTSDMLSNMLLWANTQMNGASVHMREVYLNDALGNILDVGKTIAAKKGITLEYTVDAEQKVIADTDMLGVVFRNLVNNAIKFTHPGGKILVQATSTRGICTLSVSDTGIGINPEKMEHLFTLKSEASFGTHNEKGVGLGLVLCREYIEMQGGTIHLESSDAGTTFYITLVIPG